MQKKKKKEKKLSFTVTEGDYQAWRFISEDLVEKKIFRNKTEMFETLIYFLQRAKHSEIKEFKDSAMITIV